LEKYKPGTVVEDTLVLAQTEYGIFVRIVEGIEAIIPQNEVPVGTSLKAGDRVRAEVSNIDTMDRRLTMTMLHPGESQAAEQLQVMKRESGKGATLGDLFKDKLQGLNIENKEKADES